MNVNYLTQDMIKEFTTNEKANPNTRTSVGFALTELEDVFKEDFPFEELNSSTGMKFLWTESFLYKMLWVFATDNTDDMGEYELEWFSRLVEYEEKMSYSLTNQEATASLIVNHGFDVVNKGIQIGAEATGCTLPDRAGNSYEIIRGRILLGNKCILYPVPVENIEILESLDKLIMDLYNDVPNNREALPSGELIDLTNSLNDRIKDIEDVTKNT